MRRRWGHLGLKRSRAEGEGAGSRREGAGAVERRRRRRRRRCGGGAEGLRRSAIGGGGEVARAVCFWLGFGWGCCRCACLWWGEWDWEEGFREGVDEATRSGSWREGFSKGTAEETNVKCYWAVVRPGLYWFTCDFVSAPYLTFLDATPLAQPKNTGKH
jgi:hypothetical protein